MDLLLISDLHLGPNTGERTSHFLSFLQNAYQNNDCVIIVGDLFEIWLGWSHLTFSYQQKILCEMELLAQKGLHLEYVEGNRDFGIEQLQGKIFQKVWHLGTLYHFGNKNIYVEHGDLINRYDYPYRFWRRFSKNRLTYSLLRIFPGVFFLPLAERLEKGMRSTNLKNKTRYPEDQCRSFSRNKLQQGIDIVVVGHFHQERILKIQSAEKAVLFYNLPGWESGFRYLVIPHNGEQPYFTELGRQYGNSATS